MKVLVTGASGFVGRVLCTRLLAEGWGVRGAVVASGNPATLDARVERVLVEPLGENTPLCHALAGIDTVIHLAARVHLMADPSADPLTAFRKVNTAGTGQLALQAVNAGVRRLVFVSSIKVNGEGALAPYSEESPALPVDPYGLSKWEAEQLLREIEAQTGLEVVVVRPPLVYGPGVRANFLRMLQAVFRGVPLPLASVSNRRSLVYVGNLVDALVRCTTHPDAAGETFLVSDDEAVSSAELIRRTARALGVPARLFPVPPALIRLAGKACGKSAAVERLTGSLIVNSSKIRTRLQWHPPFTMEDGLRETAQWFTKEAAGDVSRL